MDKHESFQQKVVKTATVMMCLTLFSKLLGFFRELVIAGAFGTSYVVDAYVLAQNVPNILLGGILGAISTAYTPTYSRIRETLGFSEGNRFTSKVLTVSFLIAFTIFVTGGVSSGALTELIAGKFTPEGKELTSFYLKVAFSYILVSPSIKILGEYLNYNERYFSPVIGGCLYNFGIVVVTIVSAFTDVRFLAFGILTGHLLNLLLVSVVSRKVGYRHKILCSFDQDVRQTIQMALPIFLGGYLYTVNTFIDKTLASSLQEGTISALNYGSLLITLITGLTASIIVTIMFPKLAQAFNQKDFSGYQIMAEKSSSILLMIGIPFSLGAAAFSQQVVQIVYERGAFDGGSTVLTSEVFLFYGLSIVFVSINELLTRVYYSMQDMKAPIVCAAISIAANITLNLILIGILQHRGLALATSIAAGINTLAMSIGLRRRHPELKVFPPLGKILRILLCSIAAVGGAMAVYQLLLNVWMPRIVYLGLAVLSAGVIYLVTLFLMKVEEVFMIKNLLKK